MATMLAFVAVDAVIDAADLQGALERAVAGSFNCITVDGDTSTNDACCLIATGDGPRLTPADPAWPAFQAALDEVCRQLAQAIVRDGEGATKFITVAVEQARDAAEARQVADAIAHSPLVKTAFFASDPNWGRILAAVGRAGLSELALERVAIDLDEVGVVRGGGLDPAYRETDGQRVMARTDITIAVRLGRGEAAVRIWTCDLGHDYVRINAEYRT
jgi:glutamate N-acetyltransferase/amino-acid N-acetyltransferase